MANNETNNVELEDGEINQDNGQLDREEIEAARLQFNRLLVASRRDMTSRERVRDMIMEQHIENLDAAFEKRDKNRAYVRTLRRPLILLLEFIILLFQIISVAILPGQLPRIANGRNILDFTYPDVILLNLYVYGITFCSAMLLSLLSEFCEFLSKRYFFILNTVLSGTTGISLMAISEQPSISIAFIQGVICCAFSVYFLYILGGSIFFQEESEQVYGIAALSWELMFQAFDLAKDIAFISLTIGTGDVNEFFIVLSVVDIALTILSFTEIYTDSSHDLNGKLLTLNIVQYTVYSATMLILPLTLGFLLIGLVNLVALGGPRACNDCCRSAVYVFGCIYARDLEIQRLRLEPYGNDDTNV